MKRLFAAAVAAIALCTFQPAMAEAKDLKVGVISLQEALNATKEGQKVLNKLKKDIEHEKNIIARKQEDLQKRAQELQQQGFMLNEQERTKKENELRKLSTDFKRYQEDKRSEFMSRQQRATRRIYEGLSETLDTYAKKEKFDIILEAGDKSSGLPGTVIYFDNTLDITKTIVDLYDAKKKK